MSRASTTWTSARCSSRCSRLRRTCSTRWSPIGTWRYRCSDCADAVYVGQIPPELIRSDFYLAVSGTLPEAQLRDRLPKLMKVASVKQIDAILKSRSTGAQIELEYRPPSALPIKPGITFFRIGANAGLLARHHRLAEHRALSPVRSAGAVDGRVCGGRLGIGLTSWMGPAAERTCIRACRYHPRHRSPPISAHGTLRCSRIWVTRSTTCHVRSARVSFTSCPRREVRCWTSGDPNPTRPSRAHAVRPR